MFLYGMEMMTWKKVAAGNKMRSILEKLPQMPNSCGRRRVCYHGHPEYATTVMLVSFVIQVF